MFWLLFIVQLWKSPAVTSLSPILLLVCSQCKRWQKIWRIFHSIWKKTKWAKTSINLVFVSLFVCVRRMIPATTLNSRSFIFLLCQCLKEVSSSFILAIFFYGLGGRWPGEDSTIIWMRYRWIIKKQRCPLRFSPILRSLNPFLVLFSDGVSTFYDVCTGDGSSFGVHAVMFCLTLLTCTLSWTKLQKRWIKQFVCDKLHLHSERQPPRGHIVGPH